MSHLYMSVEGSATSDGQKGGITFDHKLIIHINVTYKNSPLQPRILAWHAPILLGVSS
jgi:hypothetical protein